MNSAFNTQIIVTQLDKSIACCFFFLLKVMIIRAQHEDNLRGLMPSSVRQVSYNIIYIIVSLTCS